MDEAQILLSSYSVDTLTNFYRTITTDNGTLSPAVLAFLAARQEDVVALANKPVVRVPNVPDDLPLERYFISSSHNTYLLGWQLFGHSSTAAYTHVLCASTPARCIEIDVWWDARPGRGLPIVTHGWTFSKSVPFVDVCVAVAHALNAQEDGKDWPVFVSLECHVPLVHQDELVRIMVESWGERLVQGEIVCGESVTPRQLRGRIVLMVEYYPDKVNGELDEVIECQGLDSEVQVVLSEDDANEYNAVDGALVRPKIADSLANLGFYARSMKPPKAWWHQVFPCPPHPPNVILNINERHLHILPDIFPFLLQHASHYLRRVYPHGLRVTSSNLDPWMQWQSGTHMACLNWQRWDEPMWLNEAMFGGTGGWAVRPDPESARVETERGSRFMSRVVGLSGLPWPEGDQRDFVGYCHAELFHCDGKQVWQSDPAHVQRCDRVSAAKAKDTSTTNDVVHLTWDQSFEWTFDADPLTFILFKVVRRHAQREEDVAIFCARLHQLASGLCLVRLLNMRGKYTGATLLCEFT